MRFRKIHVSWLWIPYLILLPYLGVGKIIGWIFFILSIHEMAHIIYAIMFHYEIERVIIYPFGLSAQIAHMGHGSVFHEIYLLHPNNKGNYEAMDEFVQSMLDLGYRFDTVEKIQ